MELKSSRWLLDVVMMISVIVASGWFVAAAGSGSSSRIRLRKRAWTLGKKIIYNIPK